MEENVIGIDPAAINIKKLFKNINWVGPDHPRFCCSVATTFEETIWNIPRNLELFCRYWIKLGDMWQIWGNLRNSKYSE